MRVTLRAAPFPDYNRTPYPLAFLLSPYHLLIMRAGCERRLTTIKSMIVNGDRRNQAHVMFRDYEKSECAKILLV